MYREAAEQEDPYAQCQLGICYFEGLGVEKDPDLASELLRRSAEIGNQEAEEMLKKYFGEEIE